jgi:hypothetical protein
LGRLLLVGASDPGLAFALGPQQHQPLTIAGVDFYARLKSLELRAEYLLRRTEIGIGSDPASRFKYGPGRSGKFDPFVIKDGFYVEGLLPVLPRLEIVGRFDGLRRFGNVPATSALRKESAVLRYTVGADVSLGHGVRLKLSGEYYDFSDFQDEIAATFGVVAVM